MGTDEHKDRPFAHLRACFLPGDPRVISRYGDIGCNGAVRVQGERTDLCTLEADLFLNGEDRIDGVRGFDFPERLYQQCDPDAVVKGLAGDPGPGEPGDCTDDGDGCSDLDAELCDLVRR